MRIDTFRRNILKEMGNTCSEHPFQVQRGQRVLDKVFIHVIILLVIVAYINMGCAIDLKVIKETLRRPVAPAIGLASQYLFMPLVSAAAFIYWLCSDLTFKTLITHSSRRIQYSLKIQLTK